MIKDMTTREICEIVVENNLSSISTKLFSIQAYIILVFSYYVILTIDNTFFTLYKLVTVDYLLNVIVFISFHFLLTTAIAYFKINSMINFINKNLSIFLPKVDATKLDTLYKRAKYIGISDEKLLKYLQNN